MTLLRPSSIHPLYQAEEKHFMKPGTEDEATGKLHEVKGDDRRGYRQPRSGS